MSDLALPDFKRYRYHFGLLWWVPVVCAVLFAVLVGGTGFGGGAEVSSTAVLVPAKHDSDQKLFAVLTDLEASVAVLQGDDVHDAIEAELGYSPLVTIDVAVPSGVVTITAEGDDAGQAREVREAYVSSLLSAREVAIGESIQRALRVDRDRVAGLQAAVDSIDAAAGDLAGESAGELLVAVDRAQINAVLIETRSNVAVLESADPADFVDVVVASRTSDEGRPANTAGLLRIVGAVLAGLFLGGLVVVGRAYLDERVRTRSDVATLGLPTFSVIDVGSGSSGAGVVELAASISHAGRSGDGGRGVGLLAVGEVPVDRVLGSVGEVAVALEMSLPTLAGAVTPGERVRLASVSDGVVLLVAPGGVRQVDLLNESKIIQLSGARLLGVALVAKDARSARRSS